MPGAVGELKRGDGTVKRTVAIVAGVVTLGVALYVSGRLTADPGAPAEAAPAPTMRVRMVNLQYVIKNFKRTDTLRAEHTQLFKQYDDQINQIKTTIEGRQKQLT